MNAASSEPRRSAPNVLARIDRLPPSRYLVGLVGRISSGGWFEFYEMFMAAYISLGLIHGGLYRATTEGIFDVNGFASFLGSFFAGMFVGTVALGSFTDRFGRRSVFTCAMLIYSVATFVAAFQNTPAAMDLWRFVAGVGIGVQLITVDTYISELVPKELRGTAFAFNQTVMYTAVPTIALLAWWMAPPFSFLGLQGWSWVVLIGSVGAVLIWWIRLGLPESPRWLAQHGYLVDADRITSDMERRIVAETGKALIA